MCGKLAAEMLLPGHSTVLTDMEHEAQRAQHSPNDVSWSNGQMTCAQMLSHMHSLGHQHRSIKCAEEGRA
jgi:hypothetical protein